MIGMRLAIVDHRRAWIADIPTTGSSACAALSSRGRSHEVGDRYGRGRPPAIDDAVLRLNIVESLKTNCGGALLRTGSGFDDIKR